MSDFVIYDGDTLAVLLNGLALLSGQIAHPNLLLIYRREAVLVGDDDDDDDAEIELRDIFVFRLRDEHEVVFGDVEVPGSMRSAAAVPFSTPGGDLENLYRIVRRRLAPAVTALRFELIPPVPAEPPMDIAIGAFPADHLPVVSLSVGQIAHDIPNLIRPDNGLSPRVGIPAAHLLFYFRQMSERFRDHLGDRYRLGVSDPALQLRVASNGYQVTFALDHVLLTLSIDASQFIVMPRPGEHQHIWETAFNFQSFYRMVLHVTERSFLQPVWIAREAMWFEHYSSQGSFFLYALP